ncbi:uncharacterized protein COLE_04679 [Cutaneotrichosporon oleaginosum]|uniref:uncharacterized protein n=1 Tax=Cutaneotrichosporon oleaginosum TaxID=879819 RepID=UPI001328E244|nr:hypothetical protein COLE_04679 [Cutaneotrichosporon oleaginosum]
MAVRISYNALRADPASLKDALQAGLGSQPGALGIVLIEDLPDSYPALRTRLLRHAAALAALPEPAKRRLESPETTYSFGWSHGKEVMNGRPDTAKGSFYANPLTDRACVSAPKRARYPEYFADNIWPDAAFAAAFKALGALVAHVGIALADACDATGLAPRPIAPLIKASQCHKARLLHYFPAPARGGDDACGTHIDHSLLTALCSALYLQPRGGELVPVPPPSADAGLWIYPRGSAHAVKVQIPADCLGEFARAALTQPSRRARRYRSSRKAGSRLPRTTCRAGRGAPTSAARRSPSSSSTSPVCSADPDPTSTT